MRKRFIHTPSSTKKFQFRNRFSYNLQSTQNQDLDVQNTDEDFMDFRYDDDEFNNSQSEKLSENEEDEETDEETDEEEDDDDEVIDEETDEETGEEEDDDDEVIDEETDEETNEEDEGDDEVIDEETDEETDDEEEGDDDDDEIEDELSEEEFVNIIDKALEENKMPFCNSENEFAPYFENFTTAALFCWLQKHKISTSAYEDLAKIIHDPQFVTTHVVKNVRRIRTWRKHLPLLPILGKNISISSKKTPSTSKESKMSYLLSINDIIWHVLNNPSLMKHMYFGPGIDSEIKSEYWHGTLWGESPFFGKEKITISRG